MQKHPETQKCLKDLKNLTQDKIGDYVIGLSLNQSFAKENILN